MGYREYKNEGYESVKKQHNINTKTKTWGASVKIFRFESGFLAVLVYFRISITSYGCCPVDDPVSNKLRIMRSNAQRKEYLL